VTLAKALLASANAVIFTATTPVPNVTTSLGRSYELAVAYNDAAAAAFKSAGLPVVFNDVWTPFVAHCGAYYTKCDLQLPANVHLAPAGETFVGTLVANALLQAMGM
jgi:hypothetical protein